jgi:hypothetical protein
MAPEIDTMSIRPESRAKFEQQGALLTKLNLQMGNMDGPEQQEAVSWIAEQERASERRDSLRYRWMLCFTIVAAAAALIAAWPTVREWLIK